MYPDRFHRKASAQRWEQDRLPSADVVSLVTTETSRLRTPWSDPCSWGLASCPQMSQQSRSWSSWWWTPVSSSTTPHCSYLTRLRRGIPRPWSTGMFDLHACHPRPFAQCVICVYGSVGCMLTSSTWNVSPLEAMRSSFWQSSNC